jgi:hypothetical protein
MKRGMKSIVIFGMLIIGMIVPIILMKHQMVPNHQILNGFEQTGAIADNSPAQEILKSSPAQIDPNLQQSPSEGLRAHTPIEYSGIGQELTVLHEANRTDTGIPISFINGTTANYAIPVGEGWTGNQVEIELTNLQDKKNWVNGSFAYGNMNSAFVTSYASAVNANDTLAIQNSFQNWTFSSYDNPALYTNRFSGNYYNSSTAASKNALELLIAGDNSDPAYYGYSINDAATWQSSFNMTRGWASDAIIQFEVNPYNVAGFNSWDLRVSINNKEIYSIGIQSLATLVGAQQWGEISIPMGLWTNNSAVFPTSLDAMQHTIRFDLIYTATSAKYSSGFTNIAYQQVLFANVRLFVEAQVRSDQIGLMVDGNSLSSSSSGQANAFVAGGWTYPNAQFEFSAINNETNTISFTASFNIFATKTSPTSFSATNFDANGSAFNVLPNGDVLWGFYIYFSVPNGYQEYNFTLTYPTDWTITWVSIPQLPGTNQLNNVDVTFPGLLKIPVKDLSGTPDGFWRMQAWSPNYLENLVIQRNATITPGPGDWVSDQTFFAGDLVKLSTSLGNSYAFTEFEGTTAELNLILPNGTVWAQQTQTILVPANGLVEFSPIELPQSGSYYMVGEYAAVVRWNNLINDALLNETGIIQGSFTVRHRSNLIPDQSFFEKVLEGTQVSVRVNYLDALTGSAIENGNIMYLDLYNQPQYFAEIAPGYYFAQIDVVNVIKGNNTLTLSATHPLFADAQNTIIIEAIIPVRLIALESPGLTVLWNENFSITLNYTETSSGAGILGAQFELNWFASWNITEIGNGLYEVTLENPNTNQNRYWSLEITAENYGYQSAVIFLDIVIGVRPTELHVFLQGENATMNAAIEIPIGTILNVSIFYLDRMTGAHLQNAQYKLVGSINSADYEQPILPDQGHFMINSTKLGLGVHFLSVTAELPFHEPNVRMIQITIRQIYTMINTTVGGLTYTIVPNENLKVEFELLNLDFGGTLQGATFTFSSSLGSGELQFDSETQKYYFLVEKIPEGTYTITISGYLGPEYRIASTQIMIVSAFPEVPPGIPTWVLYAAGLVVAGMSVTLIGYLTVWKYPKIVRTLRHLQHLISRGKSIKMQMKSSRDLFVQSYLALNQPFGHYMAEKNKLI